MINIVISGGVNCENKEVAAVPDHGRHGAGGGKSIHIHIHGLKKKCGKKKKLRKFETRTDRPTH